MLKTPPASPRSLAGNHSAVAFMPAGFGATLREPQQAAEPGERLPVCASPCAMLMSDHAAAKIANPSLSPTTSST